MTDKNAKEISSKSFAQRQNFLSAMFDFDGTVTEKGYYTPPPEMLASLVKLAKKMPIAFCTGRQFESFERRGLKSLLEGLNAEQAEKFLGNLFLIAENGSVGYAYNPGQKQFEEFYKADWPEEFIKREELSGILSREIAHYGDMLDSGHRVVLVMRTNLYDGDHTNFEAVYALSDQIHLVCKRVLNEINPNYEKHLHIGNSGIGVIITPAHSDKDEGIRRFGEYLKKHRGMEFDKQYTEILAVGDSPQEGGNDQFFLSGRFGTPFTVGHLNPDISRLESVFDASGQRLSNARGTVHLVKTRLL